jgi:hypothetical protein
MKTIASPRLIFSATLSNSRFPAKTQTPESDGILAFTPHRFPALDFLKSAFSD